MKKILFLLAPVAVMASVYGPQNEACKVRDAGLT